MRSLRLIAVVSTLAIGTATLAGVTFAQADAQQNQRNGNGTQSGWQTAQKTLTRF